MKQQTILFDVNTETKKDFYDEIQEAEKRLSNMIKGSVPAVPNKRKGQING